MTMTMRAEGVLARSPLDIELPPAVSATEVTRRYGRHDSAVDALAGVSIDVPVGQFTAVMGPSGSGKSTLMHILAGLDAPTSGSVFIGGREITGLNDKQLTLLRRSEIGFVFQLFNLLPALTLLDNVLVPLLISGASWAEGATRARTALEAVGLGARLSPTFSTGCGKRRFLPTW